MKRVTVYTKNGCPQCDMTKNVLDGEGVEYEVFNIDEDQEAKNYVIETLQLSSMPVVVVEGQEPVTGFRPEILLTLK
ncbi:NrdH-redoxin [Rossellomorea marisflavi]|uniref:NrdH-redoxin n=1 Tax=Rossellomorea marisflavi TaxID=189381 RepID=A0A5D4S2E0_9BACI|nr:glutaredoxin domain-containing protein [Rossellomorea marisflavi]TYS56328.1 NrdH-redoxin [Rossellomorea marisflavi]